MLSNEQRAHDIAIALLPTTVCSQPSQSELDENGNVISRDAIKIYLNIYSLALTALNREIKEEK